MINKYSINKLLNIHYGLNKPTKFNKGIIIKGDRSWVFTQIAREMNKLFFYMNLNLINKKLFVLY